MAPNAVATSAGAPQDTIVVTTNVAAPTNDAECGLVEAVVAANTDSAYYGCPAGNGADTILLAGNTYSFTGPYDSNSALPPITSAITIEGNGSTIARTGGPNFRLIRVSSATGDLTLNESTLSGGMASYGGGLYVDDGASVTVTNSTLLGNSALNYSGGGVWANGGSVTVADSTLSGNAAGLFGAGLAAYGSSTVTVTNSTLSDNTSEINGGGLAVFGNSSVTLDNSVISGNTAVNGGGGGVGAYDGSSMTMTNSTFSGNVATGAGGAIRVAYSSATAAHSTLSGNTAGFDGGGLSASGSEVTVTNSTVSGNTAVNGGGLGTSSNNSLIVSSSTVAGNTAAYGGGGLWASFDSTVAVANSIVAGNRATTSGNEIRNIDSTVASSGYNVLGDGGETNAQAFSEFTPLGSDFVATSDQQNVPLGTLLQTDGEGDPLLANNGGPTQTIALRAGSPAIDIAPTGPAADQRGFPRPVDGDGNPTAAEYDAGAFEYDAAPTAVTLGAVTVQPGMGGFTGPLGLLIALLSLLGFKHRRR